MKYLGHIAIALSLFTLPVSAQDFSTELDKFFELGSHERLQSARRKTTNTLSLFTTDGCSGHQSQIWEFVATQVPSFAETHKEQPPWEHCCVTHDRAYHIGGFQRDPLSSFNARIDADTQLFTCIIQSAKDREGELSLTYGMTPTQVNVAYTAIAEAMFIAVRLGGAPCSGLPWRWGYGYQGCGVFD
jgi:hypothetical protein